jgi:hypothetical protein
MMMRTAAAVLAFAGAAGPAAAAAPKTIAVIVIDDLGLYDTRVYNPNSPTPNLKVR